MIYAGNQLIDWSQQAPVKKADIEIFGLKQEDLEWIYSVTVSKA